MDESLLILVGVGILAIIVGAVIGKLMDVYFRAKLLRRITKKNYGILGIVSKDWKNIKKILVNFDKDLIKIGDAVWVLKGSQIYREDHPEKGFQVTHDILKWEEGVPTAYVNYETIKPLDFFSEGGKTRPEETGAILLAWVENQIAKRMAQLRMIQTFLIIIIIAGALGAYFSFQSMNTLSELNKKVDSISEKVNILYLANEDLIVAKGLAVTNKTTTTK